MTTISSAPAGHKFANLVRAMVIAKGDVMGARAYCEGRGQLQEALLFKTLVTPTSLDDLSAAMLPFSLDLAAVLRSQTIVGRLQGLRRVPFMVRVLRQNTGARGAFVGEGRPGRFRPRHSRRCRCSSRSRSRRSWSSPTKSFG
jgi:hypothetical protein